MNRAAFITSAVLLASAITPVAYAENSNTANDRTFSDVKWYEEEINYLVNNGLIKGYPDGTFKPVQNISRLQAITILLRELKPEFEQIPELNFTDIKKGDYGFDLVAQASALGIISGKTDGSFDRFGNLTRAHFAKILVKTYEIKLKEKSEVQFSDVNEAHWYNEFVQILASHGVIEGYEDGTFKANEPITRAHFAVMLTRFLQNKDSILGEEPTPEPMPTPTPTPDPEPTPGDQASDKTKDTDKDGLFDWQEIEIGTDINNPDTDGDGLSDFIEYQIGLTSPLKKDSDNDGVLDGDEDFDGDTLTNLKELEIGTDMLNEDTDYDGIPDNIEIEIGTNPLVDDTDGDGLLDGEEADFNFDPLVEDTDGNGVIDGLEQVVYKTEVPDYLQVRPTYPSVTIKGTANEMHGTTIEVLDESPELTPDTPGYLDAAYSFNSPVAFENAEMTFNYDSSILAEGAEPAIFYFNEAEYRLEKVENQVHNPETNTVTAVVDHFSKYILLDAKQWQAFWEQEYTVPPLDGEGNVKSNEIVFSIDASGSMSSNDPKGIRKTASIGFVNHMGEKDEGAVISFTSSTTVLSGLTNDKQKLIDAINLVGQNGGTNLSAGFSTALKQFSGKDANRAMIFLTDGDGTWDKSLLNIAIEKNVKVYVIGLGSGVDKQKLEEISIKTGGKYYHASEAGELIDILEDTADEATKYSLDSDGDGIPDYFEENGLRSGINLVKTDKNNPDTDNDGLLDGEEMSLEHHEIDGKPFVVYTSDPRVKDTDFDGVNDDKDKEPRVYNVTDYNLALLSQLAYFDIESQNGSGAYSKGNIKKLEKFNEDAQPINVTDKAVQSEVTSKNEDLVNIKKKDGEIDEDKTARINPISQEKYEEINERLGRMSKGWKIVGFNSAPFSGHDGIVFKHVDTDSIVVAERGTEKSVRDVLFADLGIAVLGTNTQLNNAVDLTANAVYQNQTSELYVTGHSLGGFNAQYVGVALAEGIVGDPDNTGWFDKKILTKKEKVWQLLNENELYKRTATFNAAPFFNRPLTSDIDFDLASSSKYSNKIFNYQISYDPLYIVGNALKGTWIGKEMKPFNYEARKNGNLTSLNYQDFPVDELLDGLDINLGLVTMLHDILKPARLDQVIQEASDYSFNAHGIIQFHLHEFAQ